MNGMECGRKIDVIDEWHLLEILETMVELLVETRGAYGVVTVDEPEFMQVMAFDDGALRVESSASDKVFAADLGFNERVEEYEHIAAATIPASWPARVKMVAKTMAVLAVEVHQVQFPTSLEFQLDHA